MAAEIVRQAKEWPRDHETPALVRCGDLIVAASIAGIDPVTGARPDDAQKEFDLAFANLERLLAEAHVPLEQIGLINVWIAEKALRTHIDSAWLRSFPGPLRPARKTNEAPLQGGLRVLLQAYARRGAKLAPVEVPGMVHRSPLPPAARLGSWVFSSVIGGESLKGEPLASDPAAQIDQAFDNVRAAMEAAGGDVRGVNHMWVFLSDMAHNRAMLDTYLRMFPNEGDRPARKTVRYTLPPGAHVQVQFVGDVGGRQGNFEAPGVAHHDPIPLGSCAGGLLYSSGVHGIDPKTSQMVAGGIISEVETAFTNVETLMQVAGGSLEDIAGLTVLVRDYAFAAIVKACLAAHYGDRLPALQFANYHLPGSLNVQFHVAAALD